jgi:hypothetical protein
MVLLPKKIPVVGCRRLDVHVVHSVAKCAGDYGPQAESYVFDTGQNRAHAGRALASRALAVRVRFIIFERVRKGVSWRVDSEPQFHSSAIGLDALALSFKRPEPVLLRFLAEPTVQLDCLAMFLVILALFLYGLALFRLELAELLSVASFPLAESEFKTLTQGQLCKG